MDSQDIVFIINPKAGKGKYNLELDIKLACKLNKINPIIAYTKAKNHAKEIVNNYLEAGKSHFVAIGGDGTVNEIASQLIHKNAKLSIIPIGSGNGLARMLEIPIDPALALNKVFDHTEIKIDNGYLNKNPFFCTAGIGYDAFCADIFDKKTHGRGFLNYIKIVIFSIFKYIPQFTKFNGQATEYFSITFGNANQFGNNAYITPDANISDGYLDCTIIKKHPIYYDFALMYLLMSKKIRSSRYVEYYRATKFTLENTGKAMMHIDGDPLEVEDHNILIEVNEKSLCVTV